MVGSEKLFIYTENKLRHVFLSFLRFFAKKLKKNGGLIFIKMTEKWFHRMPQNLFFFF